MLACIRESTVRPVLDAAAVLVYLAVAAYAADLQTVGGGQIYEDVRRGVANPAY